MSDVESAGALSVIEVDGIVAATSPGQEADTRAALASQDAPIESPAPREMPSASTDGDAESPSADTDSVAAVSPTKPANPRKDATARMLEATREASRERAARQALEARLAALESQRREPEQPRERATAPAEKFPTYDAYLSQNPDATWDDWNDAKIDWKADQKVAAYQQSIRAEREQGQLRETWQGHTDRLDRARSEKYPDFDQVVANANAQYASMGIQQFPAVIQDAIIGSSLSDDLLYFLGTHPEEGVHLASQFANRPVADADLVRQILELKVAASAGARTGSAAPRPTIRAAAPPNPVGSSAPAPSVNGLGSLDPDAHIEAYRKSEAAKRRR